MKKHVLYQVSILLMLWMAASLETAAQTYYVTPTGAGAKDGSNWANASDDLQAMINGATSGNKIYVAKGTYKPEYKADDLAGAKTPSNRDNAFVLKEGVKIYGGFAGTETGDETTRTDIDGVNKTTLSGDFNDDDVVTGSGSTLSITGNGENAHHVVIGAGSAAVPITDATVLDGFTISGGNSNGTTTITVNTRTIPSYRGGGIYNFSAPLTVMNITFSANRAKSSGGGMHNHTSYPSVNHCTFDSNFTEGSGGGMYNFSSSPTITNTTFSANRANFKGGGMLNEFSSSPSITNAIFSLNSSGQGGGILNISNSSPTITNVVFKSNAGGFRGGAIHNNGSSSAITNAIFESNTANFGGGIYNVGSPITVVNSTFYANSSSDSGGGIHNNNSSSNIYNSIFWENKKGTGATATTDAGADIGNTSTSTVTVSNCLLQLAVADYTAANNNELAGGSANNIFAQNPQFVDAANSDLDLQSSSPALNVGDNSQIPNGVNTDAGGNPRIQNTTVDMGAYEYIPPTHHVTMTGAGTKDGSSWANASDDLQAMINAASSGEKIYVAKGTYKPEYKANDLTGAKTPSHRDNAFVLKEGVKI